MAAAGAGAPGAEPELTAEQYVILAEAQRKKRALAETRVKYNELVTENKRLLEEREQTEKITYEVTESMRRDIFTKNERVAALQAQLESQAAAAELQLNAQREELTERARALAAAAGEREAALTRQVDALTTELSDLEKFSREKEELERSRLRMRAEIDALQTKLEEAEAAEERRYIQGTMTLKKGFEQKYEELKKRHEEDVDERLDASVKRILQQNRRTAQELRLHMDESALLQKENQILLEERTKLLQARGRAQVLKCAVCQHSVLTLATGLQELNVKVNLEQGYVARNARQARDNKEAAGKLAALEQTLQSFVEGFERERQFMRDQWAKASANMSQEVDGYRRLVDLKMKEAKNVRRLAQEVLLQRSDVETFFVSSLQHVRAQMEAGADGEARRAAAKAQRGRDIAELSWKEREQVLRLAFAKINSQARSTHFRSLPRHSFGEAAAAKQRASEEAVPVDTLSGLVSGAGQPQLA